ncbi:reverse transcriptase domain-containing protein [Tanacetum coccineum]
MPPKKAPRTTPATTTTLTTTTTTTTPVTDEQLKTLIAQGVADVLADHAATRSRNGKDSHDLGMGLRRQAPFARECTYLDFMKCKPLYFKGTEGVFELTQWFERMETVFRISNCTVENQIKFATCTLLESALTWWNSHVRTIGHDVAYVMTWTNLKKMMTDKYFPRGEIKKLEVEMWNLKVKESNKIEKYVGGLPNMIHRSVMASKPKIMQDAIEFTTELIDKKISTLAEHQAENKRKLDNNNQAQQQPPKKQGVAIAYYWRLNQKVRKRKVCAELFGHGRGCCAKIWILLIKLARQLATAAAASANLLHHLKEMPEMEKADVSRLRDDRSSKKETTRARMVKLVNTRRKELAEQRAKERRERPMTPSQLRQYMRTYLQEEFDKIQRAAAFTRGFKRDGSPQTHASSKKLKSGGDDVNLAATFHGVSQEEADAPVQAPSTTASTAQHTGSSPKKVGTRKKRLGRKGVHPSHSTIPIDDGDPEAEHKMCIKYASDADSASDDDTPVNLHVVIDWELLPTRLGWINVIYRKDNSRKCFTCLREIGMCLITHTFYL